MADRAAFINENLGLVHACAKRFKGRGIEYDDLYGAGCVGLVKAADNFDTGRGLRFSTYALSWARCEGCSVTAARSRSAAA